MNNEFELKQKYFDRVFRIVNEFIYCDCKTIVEYCHRKNINEAALNNYAKIISNQYPDMYKDYLKKYQEYKDEAEINKLIASLQERKTKYMRYCDLLKQYIIGNYNNANEFCQAKENKKNDFRYCLDFIKAINPEIVEVFNEYNQRQYIKDNIDLSIISDKLIDWLENGIEVNGQKRAFDMSDFFMVTDIDYFTIDLYIETQKELTITQKRAFKLMLKRIKQFEKNTIPKQFVINTMATEIKNGQGELKVNNMEKAQIFAFIQNNQLPVYVFNDIMNKYLRKEILLDKVYEKTIPNNFKKAELAEHQKLVAKIDMILANDSYLTKIDTEIEAVRNKCQDQGITR